MKLPGGLVLTEAVVLHLQDEEHPPADVRVLLLLVRPLERLSRHRGGMRHETDRETTTQEGENQTSLITCSETYVG